jgi:hypothetical protein
VKDVYGKDNRLRKSTTEKQFFIDGIYDYCLDKLKKEDEVESFHKDIKYGKSSSALLFTHVPFDLLSHSNFVKMDLLESHTGLIKPRYTWYSKYYPIPEKDMSFLPFMEYLLTIFGDKVMFTPASIKERLNLFDAMKKKGVTPLTSEFSFGIFLGKG